MYTLRIAKPVLFTPGEVELLERVLDMNVEGLEDAKRETTVDPTVQTADDLNDLMSGYDEDLRTCSQVRRKVTECPQWDVDPKTIVLLLVSIFTAKRLTGACYNRLRPSRRTTVH